MISILDIRDIYWDPEEIGGSLYTFPGGVTHVLADPHSGVFPAIREGEGILLLIMMTGSRLKRRRQRRRPFVGDER